MANVVDNFNRTISSDKHNASELKGLIATLMGTNTGKPQQTRPEEQKREKKLNEVQELLKKFTKDYETEMKEQKTFFKSVSDSFKRLLSKKEEAKTEKAARGSDSKPRKMSKEEKVASISLKKLQDEFHKTIGTRGSGFVHDIHTEILLKEIRDILKATPSPRPRRKGVVSGGGGNNGGVGGGGGNVKPPDDDGGGGRRKKDSMRNVGKNALRGNPEMLNDLWFLEKGIERIDKLSNSIQKNFLGFNGFDTLVKGITDEERKFTQEIRATAYEIAGVTKDSRGLQRVFEDIGTSYSETGFERGKTQQMYLKNLRMGVKDSNRALSIAKTTLNTERLIGVEAGTLHETFLDMAEGGHLSNVELSQVGKSMRDIAKNTGITGDALVGAVKSSEQYLKNLKKAATSSAASTANIIELVAISKKLGVGDEMGSLIEAMSSTTAFEKADQQTKTLLLMAADKIGRTEDLFNGTMSKNFGGMAKGFKGVLNDYGIQLENIANMTAKEIANANRNLLAGTGRELGDYQRMIESFEEQAKPLSKKLEEINKQKKLNLSLDEQANLAEQERALKASKSLSVLTAMMEATKGTADGAKGMDQAFSKLEKRKTEFSEDMSAMGMNFQDGKQAVRANLEAALKEVNVGREKAGIGDAGISPKDINEAMQDKDMLKVVMERLFKAENELGVANKDQADAVTSAEAALIKENDALRVKSQKAISWGMNSIVGELVAILGVLASISVSVGIIAMSMTKDFMQFKSLLFKTPAGGVVEEGGEKLLKKLTGGGAAAAGASKAMPAGLGNFAPASKSLPEAALGTKIKSKAGGLKGILEGARDAVWGTGSKKGIFDKMFDVLENPAKINGQGIVNSFKDMFSSVRTTTSNGASFVKKSFTGMFGTVMDGAKKIFTKDNVVSLASGSKKAFVKGAASIFSLKNFVPVFSSMKTVAASWKGLASTSVKGIKAGYQGIKAVMVGSTLGTASVVFSPVFAAIEGVMGAFDGYADTAKNFEKVLKDTNGEYTASMYLSSTLGGALYGAINGGLLGLPGLILSLFGVEDSVKKFFTFVVHTIVVFFEGIWDGIKSAFSILQPTFDKIGEQFSRIGTAFVGMFNSIFSAVGLDTVGSLEDVFVTLWEVVKPVGQVIGWIAGMIFALPLKLLFETISFGISIIEGVVNAISGLIYAFSGVIKFIWGYVKLLVSPFMAVFFLIEGIFNGFSTGNWKEAMSTAFSNIWEYVKQAFVDMFFGIVDIAWGVLKAFYGLLEAPIKWIANLFYDMGAKVGEWGAVLFGWLEKPFKKAWKIIKSFGSWIAEIPGRIWDAVTGLFDGMGSGIWNAITGMFDGLWDGVADFGRGIWNTVTGLFDGFISFFKDPLGAIGAVLTNAISNVGTFLYDTFTSALSDAWKWFLSWYKSAEEGVASTTGKLTSDEEHAKNIASGLKQNKNMEQAVNSVATEIINDPKLSIDDKIAELASKEKLYREFSNGQSKNIQNVQKTYDDEYNSWSGSMGTNSGLLQELQMSKEKAINDKASFDRQVDIFEKERKALEQMKTNGGVAISEKTIATPVAATVATSTPTVDIFEKERKALEQMKTNGNVAISEKLIATPVAATVATSTPTVDIAKQIEQKKAESATAKTEILSPELKEMATETNEQTLLLEKMVELFQQFVDMAKPKAKQTESTGQLVAQNANGRTPKTPNNYYRSPIGHVSQTAAKSVTNTGMNNI